MYNLGLERLEYIWTIPSREACHHLRDNAHLVVNDEKQLLGFVMDFNDGTLFALAKRLNGESESSIILA